MFETLENNYNVYNEKNLLLRILIQKCINKDEYTQEDVIKLAGEMGGKTMNEKREIRDYIRMQREKRQEIAAAIEN